MNDTRFKELLNLYLDHRLSATDAKELEQAMQGNPALRRRLRGYEIMHRGCAELFRRSEADAPAPDALVQALRQAEDRMRAKSERRAVLHGWATWGTAAGAAALVALVVARVSQPGLAPVSPASATLASGQPAVQAVVVAQALPMSARATRAETGVSRRSLPEHLTLAALGIAPEVKRTETGVGTWSSEVDSSTRLASAQVETAEWMAVGQRSSWNTSPAVSATSFNARPISGWGQTGSGFQAQTAGFTFER